MALNTEARRRLMVAVALGSGIVGLYIFALYAFFAWIWPWLPDWARLIGFILVAVLVIGSPLAALKAIRYGGH